MLARALVICIALRAREHSPASAPYPWRGTATHDGMPEIQQESVASGNAPDKASVTSSFAVGYGPACAALSSLCAHAGGSDFHHLNFEFDAETQKLGRAITGQQQRFLSDDVLYDVTDIKKTK